MLFPIICIHKMCITMWIFVGTFLWQKNEKCLSIFNPPLQSLHTITVLCEIV